MANLIDSNNSKINFLWHKDFILFFLCTAQSSLGAAISSVALSFLVFKLTGSAHAMSITLAISFLPSIFTPFIATIVDRCSLKIPMMFGLLLRGLILASIYIGFKNSMVNIYEIYAMVLVIGIITSFYTPAAQSLIPLLIPKDQLQRGNSLLGVANSSMALIGLLFGGILVGLFGPILALLIEGICYLVACGMMFFMKMPNHINSDLTNTFWKDFVLGLTAIKKSNFILLVMGMFFLINIIVPPLGVLMPLHMISIGRGAMGYGIFMSLVVAGTLCGNIGIAVIGKYFNDEKLVFYGWFGMALALMNLVMLRAFYASLFWAVLFGVSNAILITGITVILQKRIHIALRARVFGSIGAIAQVGVPVALFVLSYLIDKITINEVLILASCSAGIFAFVWYFWCCRKPEFS